MLKHLFTFLLFIIAAQTVQASCSGTDLRSGLTAAQRQELTDSVEATPYAAGNHWRAERGGQIIHLVGTLHLDDPRLKAPFGRLAPLVLSLIHI